MEGTAMLFSEIYGSYYNAVAAILTEAAAGGLTRREITRIVEEKAFAESVLTIPAALEKGEWPLLDKEGKSLLRHPPTRPLTTLERRWLKALLLDPRIALFSPDPGGLEGVEPLYRPDTFACFDQYADGDPYTDEGYIQRFRRILEALRQKRMLRIRYRSRAGRLYAADCIPYRLEYSAKDDKFRLLTTGKGKMDVINLSRILSCEMLETRVPAGFHPPGRREKELVLLLREERNALERVLLHFSHLEKETRRIAHGLYEIKLRYDPGDEAELLIRVLSFGPVLEVQSPPEFIGLIKERLSRQRSLSFPGAAQTETGK